MSRGKCSKYLNALILLLEPLSYQVTSQAEISPLGTRSVIPRLSGTHQRNLLLMEWMRSRALQSSCHRCQLHPRASAAIFWQARYAKCCQRSFPECLRFAAPSPPAASRRHLRSYPCPHCESSGI